MQLMERTRNAADKKEETCQCESSGKPDLRVQKLQERIDGLLSGRVSAVDRRGPEDQRLFSSFISSDMDRAGALAAICMKIVSKDNSVSGLERSVDFLYEGYGRYPAGMTEFAAKLFLTHSPNARRYLVLRSLEQLQPGMVKSSHKQVTDQPAPV
jgi:hypothetical protein